MWWWWWWCDAYQMAYLSSADLFGWFVLTYIGAILWLFRSSLAVYKRSSTPSHQKWLIAVSFGLYAFGFVCCWIPTEILACDTLQHLQLHAVFHVTGAVGPFLWLSMAVWQRMAFRGKSPHLQFGVTAPIPYVVIPIKPKTTKQP